ncbi:complement C4-B [Thunnus maccoyii]|uniref:complement C4-B n=1 Tax=Thunnus maccoyii TaxID=8240 RepID=UPI001C4DD861|nr:complement C4-B [Thunnus maccoyii]XP_042278741.1 complement C4-B [Thunnus maccoyii]
MKCYIFSILLLILTVDTECSTKNRFFISAPSVFHVGVNEKVFVQMGWGHVNTPVTLYLEHESSGTVVSKKVPTSCASESDIKQVELMIDNEIMSRIPPPKSQRPYLVLVAESLNIRHITRVLVSKRRGYVFIQTDQPMYNPTQTVKFRIFTLDQTLRPVDDIIQISVFNAAGNRIMKSLNTAKGGILKGTFPIPDVSKMGTWKIIAHHEDDEAHLASREFKVQKFVLPTFEVSITMDESYILLNAEQLSFTISAMYSYGETVRGAYHCQFGVVKKGTTDGQKETPIFIKGLELTGSIQDGIAKASHSTAKINQHIQDQLNETLSDLQRSGAQLYLGVFVTNIQSSEMQEAEVSLPIISQRYTIDLSRTRSYFLPGYPLDVVAFLRLPDGSPAAGVPVKIDVPSSSEGSRQGITDQEGAVFSIFNIENAAGAITVEVSADGSQQRKVIQQQQQADSYLYMTFTKKIYSMNDDLSVTYNTFNAPRTGYIYYMVLSRGMLIKTGTLLLGKSAKVNLRITADMVPSFRLIGYFYNQGGDIIADSVWVDVRDECGIKVRVESKSPFVPGNKAELEIDLHGARAKVALLAVDKAFYALKADNKLTSKQVFSSMQSYDLGCSYGGGSNPVSVLTDAGLSFVSQSQSAFRKDFVCDSQSARRQRSVDLQQEMMSLKSNFSDKDLQECCVRGFSLIPMRRTCQERAKRVSLVEAKTECADVFLKCCLEGERLRKKKIQEDAQRGLGRTSSTVDIEQFFLDSTAQYIRRFFPPSFGFKEFDVTDKKTHYFHLPDSITTWEIQVATLSSTTGFCVAQPTQFKAFKRTFVSLTLPYSVKKYEQLAISPVIYNYGYETLQVAVHMEQSEGLCSPGSATTSSFVNITVEPSSSQFVTFSAVPMIIGSIPIKIRLYDIENEYGIDAIEKPLNVWTEGIEKRVEETQVLKLDGKSTKTLIIDGTLPDETVPDSNTNIFISVEGDGFDNSYAKNLLSPEKVNSLIVLPKGCLEQTTARMSPTALALRYLDLSEQWFELPAGSRDNALQKIEEGYMRILTFKKGISYGSWYTVRSSNWANALVVKLFSLVAERQTASFGQQGRRTRVVSFEEIRQPVSYLLTVQNNDGSYSDPKPVLHRGVMKEHDEKASMTAFITLALHRSLQFLTAEGRNDVEASISRATTYLVSHFEELQQPYAVAITAYCLSVCLPEGTDLTSFWIRLRGMATEGKNSCYLWTADASKGNQEKADAITVETTAYALLTAVALGHTEWADKAACWLTTQENYFGGYKATQDTMMALEALSEYELKRSSRPEANVIAEFKVPGKQDRINLEMTNQKEKVETNLKKFEGNNVLAEFTGEGDVKLKVVKAYYLLEPNDNCDKLSIRVTVEGKVKYTAEVIENYEYYDDDDVNEEKDARVPRSAIEWYDARTRNRRDVDNSANSDKGVTYRVCVSHSVNRNLTGMAIADITLLSGFEAVEEDLDKLKETPEQYISHYETSYGRVLLYFNELFEPEECISFDAEQKVPIGLLQPAPAAFYDYYEPQIKCTVFYSAPARSKMVSKLCSEDVCQCAERPCHKVQSLFKGLKNRRITKNDREEHACFFPIVDYAYIVEVLSVSEKSNFELYKTNVKDVLRSKGDLHVTENSVRVFAKRRQCKGQLDVGKQYLIMGKDGLTTDSNGETRYLLESNTWVEKIECDQSSTKTACRGFNAFIYEYKMDGCRQ